IRHFARHHDDFVAALREFTRQGKPNFFHATAHRRRDREKRAENNRDFHGNGSLRICNNESTARLISKRCSKHLLAFCRIALRSVDEVSIQRCSKRVAPSTSSESTKPAPSVSTSRQMFTRFEIKTGTLLASASTTEI